MLRLAHSIDIILVLQGPEVVRMISKDRGMFWKSQYNYLHNHNLWIKLTVEYPGSLILLQPHRDAIFNHKLPLGEEYPAKSGTF